MQTLIHLFNHYPVLFLPALVYLALLVRYLDKTTTCGKCPYSDLHGGAHKDAYSQIIKHRNGY